MWAPSGAVESGGSSHVTIMVWIWNVPQKPMVLSCWDCFGRWSLIAESRSWGAGLEDYKRSLHFLVSPASNVVNKPIYKIPPWSWDQVTASVSLKPGDQINISSFKLSSHVLWPQSCSNSNFSPSSRTWRTLSSTWETFGKRPFRAQGWTAACFSLHWSAVSRCWTPWSVWRSWAGCSEGPRAAFCSRMSRNGYPRTCVRMPLRTCEFFLLNSQFCVLLRGCCADPRRLVPSKEEDGGDE